MKIFLAALQSLPTSSVLAHKAVAINTNLLVVLKAIDLLLTPIPSRDHMFEAILSDIIAV